MQGMDGATLCELHCHDYSLFLLYFISPNNVEIGHLAHQVNASSQSNPTSHMHPDSAATNSPSTHLHKRKYAAVS